MDIYLRCAEVKYSYISIRWLEAERSISSIRQKNLTVNNKIHSLK